LAASRWLHSDVERKAPISTRRRTDHRKAPANALGYLRVIFAVDDIDETLVGLREDGAELVRIEVIQYEYMYRLYCIRGPEGLLIGLAQCPLEVTN
jgi:catechol 2,3-dioxygenase-like lactoylglutathione lyase family enzyme